MSRSRVHRRIAPWFVAVGLASAVGGCATGPGSASLMASPLPTPLITAQTTPVLTPVAPTATMDAPPGAALAADGGDPVTGQSGTYTWGDAGSDSPWLPGAPIRVGAGEPLAVTFAGGAAIASWTAIQVPSTADGPAGALVLGTGTGAPAFMAPGPGSWTVDLEIVFGAGAGTAHYAWRLDVE